MYISTKSTHENIIHIFCYDAIIENYQSIHVEQNIICITSTKIMQLKNIFPAIISIK